MVAGFPRDPTCPSWVVSETHRPPACEGKFLSKARKNTSLTDPYHRLGYRLRPNGTIWNDKHPQYSRSTTLCDSGTVRSNPNAGRLSVWTIARSSGF
eukprot:73132-Pyramimonas_sp.AAC.2